MGCYKLPYNSKKTASDYDLKVIHTKASNDYFPYGKILRKYTNGSGDERYLTTGHERDHETISENNSGTGLDNRGARFYDSDVARFLSLDPHAIDYPTLSDYTYVACNPLMFIDPDGKDIIPSLKFQSSVYYNVYQNLVQNNSIYRKYTYQFRQNNEVNYKLVYWKNLAYKERTASTWTDYNATNGLKQSAKTQFQPIEFLNNGREKSQIALARTSIHEGIHAWLYNRSKVDLQLANVDQHEYMANVLRGDIVKGIMEYASDNGIKGLSENNFQDLSWVGLTGTEAFKTTFDTQEKVDAWTKRTEALEFVTP